MPIDDWYDLSARYRRAHRGRYRLIWIGPALLAGQPGAVWEFDLSGIRKVDLATHTADQGYAVMISGPRHRFWRARELLQRAVWTFRLPARMAGL